MQFDKVLSVLRHRGPDHSGYFLLQNGKVFLGHTRLSIIDLSESGHQPMISDCGNFAITFNGEIYNYQEVKKELTKLGYHFRSKSDTEVVLNAYKEWGDKCLGKLNGMFALTIYFKGDDNHPPIFMMARDRAGKKPFYYFHKGKELVFASELKGIYSIIRHGLDIDYRALNYYLSLGYIPNDLCIAKGVRKLPPGHAAKFYIQSGKISIWRYWTPPLPNNIQIQDQEVLLYELQNLLRDSVRLRLVGDVPVGVLLSGGIDSSLVTAVAAQESPNNIKTFTVGFSGERKYDESTYAKTIADHFNTEHHELAAPDISLPDMLEDIKRFIDEPIGDSSILPTFLVSRLTSRRVKTAMGGDGGDELFGGYRHYQRAVLYSKRFNIVPDFLWRNIGKIAGHLPAGLKGRNLMSSLRKGPWGMRIWGTPYFDSILRSKLLNRDILNSLGESLIAPELWLERLRDQAGGRLTGLLQQDFQSYLPDDILAKVDRASMMNSLEIRAPWLDYRLVEWAFSRVPQNLKVTESHGRKLQKELCKKLLPKDFNLNRKQGFSLPLDKHIRRMDWEKLKFFLEPLRGIIDFDFAYRLWQGQRRGRMNSSRLFSLIMLGISRSNLYS
jgi:asparagine synthase (glutamine-hydrolysing)